jgi:hypothetical protein
MDADAGREQILDMKSDLLGMKSSLQRLRRNLILTHIALIVSAALFVTVGIFGPSPDWFSRGAHIFQGLVTMFLAWTCGNQFMSYKVFESAVASFEKAVDAIDEEYGSA